MSQQDTLADVLEHAYGIQERIRELQGCMDKDPDALVVLSDLRQKVCTDSIEDGIREVEEEREWSKLSDLLVKFT